VSSSFLPEEWHTKQKEEENSSRRRSAANVEWRREYPCHFIIITVVKIPLIPADCV
jgi:hypothetical protein